MARTQYTFTFTNAQPGSPVTFTAHVWPAATGEPEEGPKLTLNASNSVSVYSDATILTAATVDGLGHPITATATKASPSITSSDGTAPTNPFGNAASLPSDTGHANEVLTTNGSNVQSWTPHIRKLGGIYSPLDPYFGTVATPDNLSVDSLAAIQARIDAAYADGGGVVPVPASFLISGSIVMKAGVILRGVGWERSRLKLANASNVHMITAQSGQPKIVIEDLVLDGNKENQTTAGDGIHFDQGTTNPYYQADAVSASVCLVRNVLIGYTYATGLQVGSTYNGSESRLENVYVFRSGSRGIHLNNCSDMFVTNCTAGETLGIGMYDQSGAGNRWINCKVWYASYQGTRSPYVGASTTGTGTGVQGFAIASARNILVTNCESQDCGDDALRLTNSNNCNIVNFRADACKGNAVQLVTNCNDNAIEIAVGDGTSHGITMNGIFAINGTHTRNRIRANWSPTALTYALATGSSATEASWGQNDIRIGTPDAIVQTTYAATITPDPVKGGTSSTLTGNVTIANPIADRCIPRCEFWIILTQDATGGRTVTFGTEFAGMTAADTTAGKVNAWKVQRISDKWRQIAYSTY